MTKYMTIFRCDDCNELVVDKYDMAKLLANDAAEMKRVQEMAQKQMGLGQVHMNHKGFSVAIRYEKIDDGKKQIEFLAEALKDAKE